MTDSPLVLRHDEGHVARLTMDRPGNRNALSEPMLSALSAALADADADPEVRVVVLAGNGPAFSAGHDLREIHENDDPGFGARLFARCSDLMVQITRMRRPVVAEVAGVATAAGCQLVATCDLAIAGDSARFATPGVDIGLFCTTPMVAVSRSAAPKHAMEMLLTGEAVSAADAARIGLVNRAVPDEQLHAEVAALAATIAAKPPATVAIGKQAAWRQRELGLADAYAMASEVMAASVTTPEAREGIDAFLAKRPPSWKASRS